MQNLNLPEDLRNLLENILFVGVMPGPDKPKSATAYLNMLVDELLCLYNIGVPIDSDSKSFQLRAKLLFCKADYPGLFLLRY